MDSPFSLYSFIILSFFLLLSGYCSGLSPRCTFCMCVGASWSSGSSRDDHRKREACTTFPFHSHFIYLVPKLYLLLSFLSLHPLRVMEFSFTTRGWKRRRRERRKGEGSYIRVINEMNVDTMLVLFWIYVSWAKGKDGEQEEKWMSKIWYFLLSFLFSVLFIFFFLGSWFPLSLLHFPSSQFPCSVTTHILHLLLLLYFRWMRE